MIVPMKKVSLIVLAYEKRMALKALRKAGIVHIDEVEVKNESLEELEKTKTVMEQALAKLQELQNAQPKKTKKNNRVQEPTTVDVQDFSDTHARVLWLLDQQKELEDHRQKTILERDRLKEWGDFSVEDFEELQDHDIALTIYRVGRKEIAKIGSDIDYIRLSGTGKTALMATIGSPLPDTVIAQRLDIPPKSLSYLEQSIASDSERLGSITSELLEHTPYIPTYREQLGLLEQDIRFETVNASMGEDDTVAWLSGYLPATSVGAFKELASSHHWGYVLDDPKEEDNPPTQVKNSRWVSIIGPVFDILGTVPGYREYDISMWFLMFFSLFFAMIVGDGAYGIIFLLAGLLIHLKIRKANNAVILLYVLSIASIVWGAVTGTWFGSGTFPAVFGDSPDIELSRTIRFGRHYGAKYRHAILLHCRNFAAQPCVCNEYP